MYQYGNVAIQYQRDKKKRPKPRQPKQQPQNNQQRQQQQRQSFVRVKAHEQSISSGEKLLYIICIVGVVVLLSVLLTRNATISQLNFETQYLQKELTSVSEQNTNLHLIVAELSSPERIISYAKEELGMTEKHPTVKILSTTIEAANTHESTSNE